MRFLSGVFGRTNGLSLMAVVCALTLPGAAQAGFDYDERGNAFVTGQAIVAFKQGTSLLTIKSILAKYGADPSSVQIMDSQTALVNFDQKKDVLSFCQQIAASGWASAAAPNHMGYVYTTDPLYPYQWGLNSPGLSGKPGSANFVGAWSYVPNYNNLRTGTKVAVIDTGLDLRNVDFGGFPATATFLPFATNIYAQMTFTNATPLAPVPPGQLNPPTSGFAPGAPWDDFGHGTHVAGIIAAKTGDGVGVAGAAGSSILYPLKVADRSGTYTEQNLGLAIRFAAVNGCRVMNMSLGGSPGTNAFWVTNSVMFAMTQTVDNTVAPATHFKGCVLVAAMGNTGTQVPLDPADIPGVVAVGATGPSGAVTFYSTMGPWITVVAPGGDAGVAGGGMTNNSGQIFSTYPRYNVALGPPVIPNPSFTNHSYMSGTSMAAPHVAAAAALLLQKKPYLSQAQVWAQLAMFSTHVAPINTLTNANGSTVQIPDTAFDIVNGYGRLEASLLLQGKQPALGASTGVPHVFPFSPRNEFTHPTLGVTYPTTDPTQFTATGLQTVDIVKGNASNIFRVTIVDDQGEHLQSAQVTARFTVLYYTPPSPGVYPSGYPGEVLVDTVLADDGAHGDLLANDCVYGNGLFIPGDYSNCILQVQYNVQNAVASDGKTHLKDVTNKVVNVLVQ